MQQNMTRSGVVYDLTNTPFMCDRNGYRFYFSSLTHLEKFRNQVKIKEDWLCDSLSRRFNFSIDARLIADFQLYQQIEKRGFYVTHEGEEFTCTKEIMLTGARIEGKNSDKQCVNTMPQLLG